MGSRVTLRVLSTLRNEVFTEFQDWRWGQLFRANHWFGPYNRYPLVLYLDATEFS